MKYFVGLIILIPGLPSISVVQADDTTPRAVSSDAVVAAKAVHLPQGFTIAAVASEPHLANPVAFCFDPKGRIFVAETYRVHKGVEDNRLHMDWLDDDLAAKTVADRRAYIVRRTGNQIDHYTKFSEQVRLLDDRDLDGRYETSSIFSAGYDEIEDGAAAGVLWVNDRLLFTCIPSLWELQDADGDGRAEQRRALATGFGVHFALFGHDLHGLKLGPDGKIYFSIGDRGLQVDTPHGTLSNPNSGAVIRCNPDGSDMELFATGLRNPQELAFNELGDLFTVDNNSDSGDRARLVHVVEGMQAGWRMSYQYLPDRGPFNREKIWYPQNDEQPASIVPPVENLGDGPSGLTYYPGTGLPAKHAGSFFLCDFRGTPGLSGVREFSVKPNGATYKLERNDWFIQDMLATDCDFGPDGGLYVADWIEGWGGVGKGRIDRVVSDDPAATKERLATAEVLKAIASKPGAELPALLGHADMAVRLAAQQRLVAAGLSSAELFSKVASANDSPRLARLHAIWGLGQLAEQDSQLFATLAALLGDDDPEIRAQAAKTLERADQLGNDQRELISKPLLPLLTDESPRMRTFAAITLGRLKCEAALPALLALARNNDNKDAVLRHAAAFGLAESQAPETIIVATAKAGDAERLAIAVALGRQKSPLVAKLLSDSNERVRLEAARVIWDTPIPEACPALASILDAAPSSDEPLVRRALAANQAGRTADNLRAMVRCALRPDLSAAMREHAWGLIRQWASPSPRDPVHGDWRLLSSRPADEAVAVLEQALPKIRERGADGAPGIVVAAELGAHEAFASLMEIIETQSYPQELRARAVAAIGGAEEAVASQAIDAALKSERPEVRSAARRLLVQRFPVRAVKPLRTAAESATMPERQTAIDLLATIDRPEAAEVVAHWMERVSKGDCPPELVLNVLEAAAKSKDPKLVAAQKTYLEKLAGAGPVAAQSASLVGGDAERGQKLFSESEALACRRCHGVVPGKVLVGPNLADVGLRRTRNELLESVVAPNAKIAEGFKTTVFLLDTGKVVAGIVKREDAKQAVLMDPENKEIDVDLAEVENRSEGLSAMPQDIAKQLSPRDLRDLVEYLTTLRTPNTPAAEQPKDSAHADAAQ